MSHMAYRKELDGARALCIISVVLFHVGYPSLSGGFIGVDVFFVLSGYLICGQMYLRMSEGRFSARDFFTRRIRRLAPAYGLCFLTVALLANAFFLRSEMGVVATNFLGSILFINNFQLMGSAGYFAGPNAENPFLHTWTLSIEEQFYIVVPLLAVLLQRNPRRFAWMLGMVFVVSLGLTLFSGDLIYSKDERYFSSSFRVWQIASGGLAFLALHHGLTPARVRGASLVGVALILTPVFTIDSAFLYPYWVALAPVVGAVLLILFSVPATPTEAGSLTGRALAWRPMAYLGRISYGTYLWHWPLIVGVIYYGVTLTDEIRAVIVLASFALGAMSYHFVEMPVRVLSVAKHQARLFGFFAVQMTVMLGLAGYLFYQANQAEDSENARLAELKAQIMNTHAGWDDCWNQTNPANFCPMGVAKETPDFLLYGDSMANSAFFAFNAYGKANGQSGRLVTSPGCAAMVGVAPDPDCIAINAQIMAYLDQAAPMDVFLMGWWSYYSEGFGNFGDTPGSVPLFLEDGTQAPENFPAFVAGLDAALARISARHRVILINSFPKFETSIPKAMLRNLRFGSDLPVLTREVFETRQGRATEAVARLAEKYDVTLIEPHRTFCGEEVCKIQENGFPLYMDQVHLGPYGNDLLLEIVLDELEDQD